MGQTFCGDHIGGLFGLWNVQRDEISLFEQLIQLNFGDAHFVGFFFRQERIKGQHFHLEAFGAVTNDSTDVARTDYAKCFTRQLNTHEFGLFPFACMRGGACFGDLTRHSKHHRNRMFGGCGHVAERGVHHDDTLFGRGVFVDVVCANSCTANNLQVVSRVDDFLSCFGGRANGQTVIFWNSGQQGFFVFAEVGHEVHINAAITENLNCCF